MANGILLDYSLAGNREFNCGLNVTAAAGENPVALLHHKFTKTRDLKSKTDTP